MVVQTCCKTMQKSLNSLSESIQWQRDGPFIFSIHECNSYANKWGLKQDTKAKHKHTNKSTGLCDSLIRTTFLTPLRPFSSPFPAAQYVESDHSSGITTREADFFNVKLAADFFNVRSYRYYSSVFAATKQVNMNTSPEVNCIP